MRPMAKSMKVEVNPLVFKWLRVSSGWSVEEVSKRLKTSVDRIESIEGGKQQPTLRQLNELSIAFKRPIASFLLPKPLKEPSLPKDYRMLPAIKDRFDKKTLYVIRKARNLQTISNELSANINYSTKPLLENKTIKENPNLIAEKFRDYFQLNEKKVRQFASSYPFFSYLRDIFEDLNILVFQFSMPIEDARGFALTDMTPNVIVVNNADSIEARVFSLMHEFGHVLLGETIIDFPGFSQNPQTHVEKWCNEFASSFLLPPTRVHEIFSEEIRNLTDTKTLQSLSRRYKVSKGMLLFNMYKQKFISIEEYKETIARYQPKDSALVNEAKEKEKKGGGITADRRCLSEIGGKFVSIVANNYDRNFITYTDALSYLSIKSKNFNQVLARAVK